LSTKRKKIREQMRVERRDKREDRRDKREEKRNRNRNKPMSIAPFEKSLKHTHIQGCERL
jgi:hypothetical protein